MGRLSLIVVGQEKIEEFCRKYAAAEQSLYSWFAEAVDADWQNFENIFDNYEGAQQITDSKIMFHVDEEKYKLETLVLVDNKLVIIERVGTHKDLW